MPLRAVPRSRAVWLVVLVAIGGLAWAVAPRGVPGLVVDVGAEALPAPPELRLRAPSDGQGVGAFLEIAGEAVARESSLSAVEFRVDGGTWRPAVAAPAGAASPFAARVELTPGDHLVEARARDGNVSSLVARALVRSAALPPATLRILSPTDGQGVGVGELTVVGAVVGDAPVVVSAGGREAAARVLPGGAWEAKLDLPEGEHLVVARSQGPGAGLPASVRVKAGAPLPPTLSIGAPRAGASFGSAGDAACPDACILFAGALEGGDAVQALLDGERAPGSAPFVVGGAWTYRLPMSRLYAGEHRMAFVPLAGEARGLAQEVAFAVRTPKVVNLTGDLAPQPTLTPLELRAEAPPGARVRWSVDGVFLQEGPDATLTFSRPGSHDVRVESTDAHGRVADVLHTLFALDRPPVVGLAPPQVDGTIATFVASASDADGLVVEYAWEFGDGASATTSAPTVRHRYLAAGSYRANVTAVDELGARSAVASVLVRVVASAPRASFEWEPYEPSILDDVSLRDTSSDPEGAIVSRTWEVDGAPAQGSLVRHRFSTRGPHAVTLRLVDVEGVEASVTHVVQVRDLPPAAAFAVVPSLPRTGEPVLFADASSDPDGPVVSWAWDFGDGSNATGSAVAHVFRQSGAHQVTLRATDDMGMVGEAVASVVVQDVEPDLANVTVVPERPRAKDEVVFAATPLDAEGLVNVLWDFGDGARDQGDRVVHRYGRSGQYTVNVTVVDGAGQMRSRLFPLAVGNAPPAVAIEAPERVYAAFRALFLAEAQDPDGRVSTYRFDLDEDGLPDCAGPEPECVFVYERPGTYLATVRVTDDEGGNATSGIVVDVLTPPAGLAPPRVTIGAPAGSATVKGLLRVEGTALAPRPVRLVEAQLREDGWTLRGQRPWQTALGFEEWRLAVDTASFPDGEYDLVVRATDDAGAQGLALTRITLANGARESEVALRILHAPGTLAARDVVRGSAYHPDGITAVRWRLDEGAWAPASGPPLAFEVPLDARGLSPGDHVLTVAAYRGVADKREVTRVITVPGAVPELVVDVAPTETAYGLLRAAGRVTAGGQAQWRLDHGLWRVIPSSGPTWLLDEETQSLPAGPHTLQIRAASEDGRFTSEPRSWRIEIVNPPPLAKTATPSPVPQEQTVPSPFALAPTLALAVAIALGRRSGPPPARP